MNEPPQEKVFCKVNIIFTLISRKEQAIGIKHVIFLVDFTLEQTIGIAIVLISR